MLVSSSWAGHTREVLTVNVGQCGIQLGRRVWEQYNVEHGISTGRSHRTNGKPNKQQDSDLQFKTFYAETESGKYCPRNLVVDLDPETIDCDLERIGVSNSEFHVSGTEDAANNFARGHYTVGKETIDKVTDRLRMLVDNCDNVQGFILNHAVGGGTGSGLGALILERIAVDYRKKSKLGIEVYPFNNHLSTCVVEPYNALLTAHWLLDHTEMAFVFDNRKLYDLCQSKLEINEPSYNDLNTLIAKIASSHTNALSMDVDKVLIAPKHSKVLVDGFVRYYYPLLTQSTSDSLQFEPPLYCDLMELIYKSYTDQFSQFNKTYYDINCINDLFEMSCDSDYFLVECEDFDVAEDKYMFVHMICSGDVTSKEEELNAATRHLEKNNHVVFVDWCPSGFKLGLNEHGIPRIDKDDKIAPRKKFIQMIGNNTCMSRFFSKRICKKYDKMYSQRAYVHWYIGEGLSEGEFAEARENLGFLEKDYLDILSEQASDERDDDVVFLESS
eukprot:346595_1